MLYAARVHGPKQGFGMRRVVARTEEIKILTRTDSSTSSKPSLRKPVELFTLSPYEWTSYEQALQDVRDLGCGLRTIGAGDKREGQYFGIYAPTSRNWMFMAQACAFNGVPICTVYDTASTAAVAEAFDEARVPALFTDASLLPALLRQLSRTPTLRAIVYDNVNGASEQEIVAAISAIKNQYPGIQLHHIDAIRQLGREHALAMADRARRNDIFCLMYTSGGGGKPKGVLLTHGNVLASVASIAGLMKDVLADQECYLAFLPAAHVIEFIVEMTFIFTGVPIAYGRIKTLSDANVKGCKGDIMEARPSVMIAVPTVWELLRKGIMGKVSSGLKKTVFNTAMKAKYAGQSKSIPGLAKLSDAMVFNRVRELTGGRLRTILNSGTPLSPSTQKFLSLALVQMIQAYGMTECGGVTIQHPNWRTFGSVGGPAPGCEIRLVDRLDVHPGYSSNDSPPRGEVYVRGPSVCAGYHNRDLNRAAFTNDGWFLTGDIGQWNPDGTLTIIDRVKNHVPLAGGTGVALERLESIYKSCPLITNCCVVANPFHARPALIAVVHQVNLPSFARKHGIPCYPHDIEVQCRNPRLVSLVLEALNETARREGLRGVELLEALVLTADEWSSDLGMLTAAQKLIRPVIDDYYEDELNRVYTSNGQHYYNSMKGDAELLRAVANRPRGSGPVFAADGERTPTLSPASTSPPPSSIATQSPTLPSSMVLPPSLAMSPHPSAQNSSIAHPALAMATKSAAELATADLAASLNPRSRKPSFI
ncbi:long-chain fatty acid-CoA ligase [Vanrija albida]|uniref:Long-chain fatty acid-CoA ligase n=1 Tax=Vanrija albida TaxID=181172 RepID=A0ABR3QD06_9TREE